jgi:hypothetical protein
MPAKKPTATAKKIVDVSHPSAAKTSAAANASGVPLIVKNRPIMHDPMMVSNSDQPDAPEASKPSKKDDPIIKKITLEPLAPLIKVGKNDDDNEEPVPVTVNKAAPADASEVKVTDAQPEVEKVEVPVVAAHTAERVLKPSEATIAELAERAKAEKEKAASSQKSDTDPKPEGSDTKPVESQKEPETKADTKDAEAVPAADDSEIKLGDAGATDGDLLKDDKQANPEAVKVARAAAEKQLALDKLISDGTYVLPINAVEKRRQHRSIAVILLVVVVLAVAGLILALDAGYVHIPGFTPPTDFLSD